MDGDNREHASEENGDTEVQEQYQEENGDNLEEAPQTNADEDNMQNCDLFGEVNAPAGDEAETEEVDNTAEGDNNEQEDTAEKPAEETAEENQEKKEAETTGDSGEPSDDAKLQPGTKTNSDRQQDIFSRVFVGHLPTDRCSREDVEKLFSEYGEITGCSVLNGYGFVQYRTPDSVDAAIKHLHGHHFFGANIVVDKTDAARQALGEKPQKRPPGRSRGGYGGRQGNYQPPPPPRSHGYRDYGPPPYHPRGYGPPPHHYDHRDSYYQPPPQRRGPPQHGYGYHRPRDDYYDSRPYDYHDY